MHIYILYGRKTCSFSLSAENCAFLRLMMHLRCNQNDRLAIEQHLLCARTRIRLSCENRKQINCVYNCWCAIKMGFFFSAAVFAAAVVRVSLANLLYCSRFYSTQQISCDLKCEQLDRWLAFISRQIKRI